jgi:hypothetical protein
MMVYHNVKWWDIAKCFNHGGIYHNMVYTYIPVISHTSIMDWFKGKSIGNHGFLHDFLNQICWGF